MDTCEIEWKKIPMDRWDAMFATVRRSTLLQHYPYAQALRATQQLGARHGVIHLDGHPAGLIQIGEAGLLGNAIHAITLDRGPLWFDGYRSSESWESFLAVFTGQFPKRLGRKRRIIPELESFELSETFLRSIGLIRNLRISNYKTAWLDLDSDTELLRARLKGKWRNTLSKSKRSALILENDEKLAGLGLLLERHEASKSEKGFSGPSAKLMKALVCFMAPRGEVLLLHAKLDGRTVASVLILVHGRSSTYQIGWTSGVGRKLGAHQGLLWKAIVELKALGIRDFDLGGLNQETAAGVTAFKAGLGGTESTLIGMYH